MNGKLHLVIQNLQLYTAWLHKRWWLPAGVPGARLAPMAALCALAGCFSGFVCVAQQPKAKATADPIKGEPPAVTMNAKGCPVLKLTDHQRAAVEKFQQAHPAFEMYDYAPTEYSDGSCLDTYRQWHDSATDSKAVAQYPFAVWGDFNHDGLLDVAVFFVGRKPAVTHKWPMNGRFTYTYDYDWLVVVFQGSRDDTFQPVIAGKDRWARAMDGVVFNPGSSRIEYWFKTAEGSVHWSANGYQMVPMKSND